MGREYDQDTTVGNSPLRIRTRGRAVLSNPMTNRGTAFTAQEREVLEIDGQGDVANCAITEYRFDAAQGRDGKLVLARYNVTAPMRVEATPVTREPDKMVAARG